MSNQIVNFPVPPVNPPALPVTVEDQTSKGITATQNGTMLVITDANVPPVTTVKIFPVGGADNVNWITQMQSAIKQGIPAELTPGIFKLNPFNFDASLNGLQLLFDAGVTIQDASIFSQFACMLNFLSGFSGTFKGTAPTVTMPINYANAKKQVASGLDYEYQHGLCFSGVDGNIQILSGMNIVQAAGDGVNFHTIGPTGKLTLNSIISNNNIRQGWSVTGKCVGSVVGNNCGANLSPHSGFDFEPDLSSDSVTGFVFNNFSTSKNAGGGVSFGFFNGDQTTQIDVTFNNLTSSHDFENGIQFWNNNNTSGNPTGKVTVNGYSVDSSQYDGTYGRKSSEGWEMIFNNGTISNPNQGGRDPHYGSLAALGVAVDGGQNGTPGGVHWNGVTIVSTNPAFDLNGVQDVTVTGTYNGRPISFP